MYVADAYYTIPDLNLGWLDANELLLMFQSGGHCNLIFIAMKYLTDAYFLKGPLH